MGLVSGAQVAFGHIYHHRLVSTLTSQRRGSRASFDGMAEEGAAGIVTRLQNKFIFSFFGRHALMGNDYFLFLMDVLRCLLDER